MSQAIFVVFHRPTPRYNLWHRDFALSKAFFKFIPKKMNVYVVDSGWYFREPPHPRCTVFHSDHNPFWLYLERHLPEVVEDQVLIVHPDTLLYGRDCISDTFKQLATWGAVGTDDSFFAAPTAVFRKRAPLLDFGAFIRGSGLRVKPPNRDERDVILKNNEIRPLDEAVQSPRTAFYHMGCGSLGLDLVGVAENDPYLFDRRVSHFGVPVAVRAVAFKQLTDGLAGTPHDYYPLIHQLLPRTLWDRYVRVMMATLRFMRPAPVASL